MTTQSSDQSNSQSQGEEIDRIADKWAKLEIPSNKHYVPFMRDRYRAAITEAIESLSQSPAPSKDIPQPEVTYRVYMRRKGDARWYSQESSDYEGDVRYWARLNNERNDGREYIAVKETRTFELL